MSNNASDYENDLVFPPKSADDLNEQEQEIKQLRALLKECRDGLTEISKDYGYCVAEDINKIIAKIKAVIGESEE